MPDLSKAPAKTAVTQHKQSAHSNDADSGIPGDAAETGDHRDAQQRADGMRLKVTVTTDNEKHGQKQEEGLGPDHGIYFQQAGAQKDEDKHRPLIPARGTTEPVHHPPAKPDEQPNHKTVEQGTEHQNEMRNQQAEADHR